MVKRKLYVNQCQKDRNKESLLKLYCSSNDDISIKPAECTDFWVSILTIILLLVIMSDVDNIISICSFKILGMKAEGFKNFYCANTRSLLSYAALPGSLCLAISSHPGKIFTGIEPEAF